MNHSTSRNPDQSLPPSKSPPREPSTDDQDLTVELVPPTPEEIALGYARTPISLYRFVAEGKVTHADLAVLNVMQRGGGESRVCYMSHATIAKLSGLDNRSVRRSLARLKSAGLIRLRSNKHRRTTEWVLVWMWVYLDPIIENAKRTICPPTSSRTNCPTNPRACANGRTIDTATSRTIDTATSRTNCPTTKSPFGGVQNSPDGGVSREASPPSESSACGGGPPPPTPPSAPPKGEEKTSIQSRPPSRLFPFERPEGLSDPEILEWSKSPETIATWGKVCSKIEEGERKLAWAMTQLGIAKGEEQSELTLAGRAREAVDLYFDLIGMLDGVMITPVGCSPTWNEDVIRRDRLARIMAIEETRNAYKAKMEENRPTPPPDGPKGGGMVNPPSPGNGSLLERPKAIPKQVPPPEKPAAMIGGECEPGSRVSHPDYGLGTVQDYDLDSDKGSILFDRMSGQPKLFIFSKSKLKFLGMMPSPPTLPRLKTPEECEAERERQLAALKDRSNNHETRSMQP